MLLNPHYIKQRIIFRWILGSTVILKWLASSKQNPLTAKHSEACGMERNHNAITIKNRADWLLLTYIFKSLHISNTIYFVLTVECGVSLVSLELSIDYLM